MTPYPHLFTPIKIGGQLIKNRIVLRPHRPHELYRPGPSHDREYGLL